jgi:DNA-binding XRE family transcriptional regulator
VVRFLILEVTKARHDPRRAQMERMICGIRQHHLSDVIGCPEQSISRWERGERIPALASGKAYIRLVEKIHEHVAVGYKPCPTVVMIAPNKWTPRIMKIIDLYEEAGYVVDDDI